MDDDDDDDDVDGLRCGCLRLVPAVDEDDDVALLTFVDIVETLEEGGVVGGVVAAECCCVVMEGGILLFMRAISAAARPCKAGDECVALVLGCPLTGGEGGVVIDDAGNGVGEFELLLSTLILSSVTVGEGGDAIVSLSPSSKASCTSQSSNKGSGLFLFLLS